MCFFEELQHEITECPYNVIDLNFADFGVCDIILLLTPDGKLVKFLDRNFTVIQSDLLDDIGIKQFISVKDMLNVFLQSNKGYIVEYNKYQNFSDNPQIFHNNYAPPVSNLSTRIMTKSASFHVR